MNNEYDVFQTLWKINCHGNLEPMTTLTTLANLQNGFNAHTAVEHSMQCHETNGAILMSTVRTSLLSASLSPNHVWLVSGGERYLLVSMLHWSVVSKPVTSCTHLWEAIGTAALSFLNCQRNEANGVWVKSGNLSLYPPKHSTGTKNGKQLV